MNKALFWMRNTLRLAEIGLRWSVRGDSASRRVLIVLLVCLVVLPWWAFGQVSRGGDSKRARPPKFDDSSSAIFFEDVFSKLVGERPANLNAGTAAAPAATAAKAPASAEAGSSGGGSGWSAVISATTIEDEVKAIKQDLDKNVTTPSEFAGRGHKPVRRDLSVLAMLFAIIGQYDGEVRWKPAAPTVRDLFARTAANTKAGGNAQVYAEAKLRKTELEEILGGNTPAAQGGEVDPEWPQVCDRSPLMQRLEAAFDAKLNPLVANKDELTKNKDQARHEAEIIAAIGEVLTKQGMADADDSTYTDYAQQMKKAALEITEALKTDNYEKSREAVGVITKMCTECHESYRG